MKYFRRSDLIHKYLTSFSFRIILLLYSFFLISIQNNIFSFSYYILYFVVYFIIYVLLIFKQKAFLRTINDYILIFFTLYLKDFYLPYNIIFILLPLFNSPNHTGEKRNVWSLLFLTILVVTLLYITNPNTKNDFTIYYTFVGMFVLSLISYFELSRAKLFKDVFTVFLEIDDLTKNVKNTTMIPEIYKHIISKIKRKFNIDIKQITCFERRKKNKYVLKNSSKFVYSYDIKNINNNLDMDINPTSTKVYFNDNELNNVLIVNIDKYMFLFLTDKKYPNLTIRNKLYISEIVILIFEKIVQVIEQEDSLLKERQRQNKSLTKKQHYVFEIIKSTHFISNKLSPIKNYFTLQLEMDNSKLNKLSKEQQKELRLIKRDETKRARISLKKIYEKIDLLLNKELNPFIPTNTKTMKYKAIFMQIKKIWLLYFSEDQIKIIATKENIEKKISTNNEILELIFTDLFTNMTKYSISSQEITFNFSDNFIVILKNIIKDYSVVEKNLMNTIDNFNKNNKLEINKRNNFGLAHVKELCEQLNIDIILELNKSKKMFIVKMEFKGD